MSAALNLPPMQKNMIALSVMMATVMQVIDTTIANVALPHIQGSLSATQDQISWVLTSYIVASAIATPPIGWLEGRFGRKKVFMVCVAGFTLASLLCGMATSLPEIVLFRLLQGMFGSGLVPLSQSVLLDINPKEKHGAAMALWGIGVMIGPILGPTLGGWITENYSWRWVFYINLPLGVLALLGIFTFMHESERRARPFDWFGFTTLSLGLACLQLMLDRGERVDWFSSAEIIIYAGLGVACLWMFVVRMMQAEHPFLTLSLFKDRNLLMGLIFIFFVGIILLATLALLPPYMQNLMGYPVIDVGLLMVPRGVGTMIAMIIVGAISNKVDPRALILLGLGLTILSLWQMAGFTTFVPGSMIAGSGFIQGLGLGFIFVPLNTISFSTLPPQLRTEAAGLYSLMRNIGSSIGISVVIALLTRNTQINHAYIGESVTAARAHLAQYLMPQVLGNGQSTKALALLDAEVNRQAATIAYIDDFRLMMWVVMAAVPLTVLLRRPERGKKQESAPAME
ncbi:MAG TPA: DHA2 family efflux MFS transporter permease subunit [Alphaproteobacteria bacterium]|nr:DHA2 family efflux MFS transporter permease subunit [Alphaproteobacteria bacterium]